MASKTVKQSNTPVDIRIDRARTSALERPSNVKHLRLVPKASPTPSQQVIKMAEQILDFARRGEIQGLIVGMQWAEGAALVDIAGECAERPTLALGIASLLTDELKALQHSMISGGVR